MKMRKSRRLLSGICVSSALLSVPAWAQQTPTEARTNNTLDKVEVTGIRAALIKARDEKRFSPEILDAVSSEDVGKFPDKNIAEALQRVPGLTIDRNRGEGNFVSVRGLPASFVRGSVNGRTIVSATESYNSTLSGGVQSSTGRETNFDVLPSEIVDVMQVYKSNSAEHIEGGVAGVVNIQTARPLMLGHRATLSGSDLYSTLSGKHAPNLSGLWSWKNADSSFGALVSATFSERHIRQGNADSFAYSTNGTFGYSDKFDTKGAGSTNAQNVLFPFSLNPEVFDENRKNQGLNTTLQWRPAKDTEVRFDALVQQRRLKHTSLQGIYQVSPGLFSDIYSSVPSVFGPKNPDGSIPFASLVVGPDNTARTYQTAADLTSVTDVQAGDDRSVNLGLNASTRLSDWKLSADLAYAKAHGEERFDRATFMPKIGLNAIPGLVTVNTTGGAIAVTPDAAFAKTIADASLYRTNNFQQESRKNDDSEQALRLDAERALSNLPFSEFKVGVRLSQRRKELAANALASGQFKNAAGQPVSLSLTEANAGVTHLPTDLVPGLSLGWNHGLIPFAQDPTAVINALAKLAKPGTLDPIFNALQSYSVEEKTSAAYAQLNIDTQLGATPITGNVGLRYVSTNTTATGYRRPFEIVTENNLGTIHYTSPDVSTLSSDSHDVHWLPSLNLKAELTPELAARFSYSKSLTRPLFSDLTPAYTGTPNPTQKTAAIGNSNLKPLTGENFDLALEWYRGKDGMVSLGGFSKRLNGIVGNTTELNVNYDNNQWVSLTKPSNLGKGRINGGEFSVQMPLDALSTALQGLGLTFNYTRTNSSTHDNKGATIPFPGVSKYSLNTSAYYERGPVQVRLAYTYRDQYMVLSSDVFGQQIFAKGYGQMDLSAAYDLNKTVSLFGNVINLGGARETLFSSNVANPATADSRPQSVSDVGRRFVLGLRIKL
ncbi:TonB-dependent receptor [Roseateles sp. BYS180W]|uniref:TonB-dependent receptor n=1 Tax=Roseateles rivi TaxID=3299028 RepID=A0ABW7FV11_9BURK